MSTIRKGLRHYTVCIRCFDKIKLIWWFDLILSYIQFSTLAGAQKFNSLQKWPKVTFTKVNAVWISETLCTSKAFDKSAIILNFVVIAYLSKMIVLDKQSWVSKLRSYWKTIKTSKTTITNTCKNCPWNCFVWDVLTKSKIK